MAEARIEEPLQSAVWADHPLLGGSAAYLRRRNMSEKAPFSDTPDAISQGASLWEVWEVSRACLGFS